MQIVCKLRANACEFSCTSHAYLHACMHVNLHAFRTQFACKKMHAKCIQNVCKSCANYMQKACEFAYIRMHFGCIFACELRPKCMQIVCKLYARCNRICKHFGCNSQAKMHTKCMHIASWGSRGMRTCTEWV